MVVWGRRLGGNRRAHSLERLWGRIATRYLRLDIDQSGLQNVDPVEQYVVVALHESLVDPVPLLSLPLGLRFVARDELFEWPAVGRYLTAMRHPKVATRPNIGALRRFVDDVERVFEEGDSLVIFPQGSVLGIEIGFQRSALRVAQRWNRPLLPVVLTGGHRVWEHPFSPRLRFGQPMTMKVFSPVQPDDLTEKVYRDLERTMKAEAMASVVPARRFEPERDGWWDDYHYRIDPDFAAIAERSRDRRTGRGEPLAD